MYESSKDSPIELKLIKTRLYIVVNVANVGDSDLHLDIKSSLNGLETITPVIDNDKGKDISLKSPLYFIFINFIYNCKYFVIFAKIPNVKQHIQCLPRQERQLKFGRGLQNYMFNQMTWLSLFQVKLIHV